MLGKEFKTWPADHILNATLLILSMYVTNPSYLEDRPFYFTKLSDGGTEESNKTLGRLNNAAIISNNDNKYPPDLPNLEIKWEKKKKEKA